MAYGKIARLPRELREQINRRLVNNEPGNQLVAWLNGLPEVQAVLAEHFGGREINEDNLSEWKQHGHQDWLRGEVARDWLNELTDQADSLDEQMDEGQISDRFGSLLAAELTRLGKILIDREAEPAKRWERLCEVQRVLSQLRRDDHRAILTGITRGKNLLAVKRELTAKLKSDLQEQCRQMSLPLRLMPTLDDRAEEFGGGVAGRKIAARVLELENGLKPGSLGESWEGLEEAMAAQMAEEERLEKLETRRARRREKREPAGVNRT